MAKVSFKSLGETLFNSLNLNVSMFITDKNMACNLVYSHDFKSFSGKMELGRSIIHDLMKSGVIERPPYLPFISISQIHGVSVAFGSEGFGTIRTRPNFLLGEVYSAKNFGETLIKDISIRFNLDGERNNHNLVYAFDSNDLDEPKVILGENSKVITFFSTIPELEEIHLEDRLKPLRALGKPVYFSRQTKGRKDIKTNVAVLTGTGMLYKVYENEKTGEFDKFELTAYMQS